MRIYLWRRGTPKLPSLALFHQFLPRLQVRDLLDHDLLQTAVLGFQFLQSREESLIQALVVAALTVDRVFKDSVPAADCGHWGTTGGYSIIHEPVPKISTREFLKG
jgi:hypothetical protein